VTHRPHMPLSVKLRAAILQLGLDPARVDFDHNPALGLREFNEETKAYTPDANDPRFITVLDRGEEHRSKTSGTPATSAGSDVHRIAKSKRLAKAQAAHNAALAEKVTGGPSQIEKPRRPYQWPKGRKLQNRPLVRRISQTQQLETEVG
jgi:hypothetical protein